jgi:hypothetical protein
VNSSTFFKKFPEFPLTFRPLFWAGNEGLKKYPKTTNFRQFPLSFCQKVTKKLQKAHKNGRDQILWQSNRIVSSLRQHQDKAEPKAKHLGYE